MDGTLDAWLNKPVSNGLLLIITVVVGLCLCDIGRGLDSIIMRLNDLQKQFKSSKEESDSLDDEDFSSRTQFTFVPDDPEKRYSPAIGVAYRLGRSLRRAIKKAVEP